MSKIMSVNAGSSSLKFKLYDMPSETVLCSGNAERIGLKEGIFGIKYNGQSYKFVCEIPDHNEAILILFEMLIDRKILKSLDEIKAIGHRIVQGGKYFHKSEIVTEDVENKIESLIPLAPLHNKAHLIGIRSFKKALPNVANVVVFDTAFHQTMAPQDYLFPIPYEYSEKYDCRRYGFHGTSHHYLSLQGEEFLQNKKSSKIISCHIGSGASICAIENGKCIATSMGLTPLGGIMMGTRCGDIDPSVMHYLCKCTGKSIDEIYEEFNKESGFKGVSQISSDSRDIEEAVKNNNKLAIVADDLFIRRILDYIGQYFVRLGGVDLIIFSAGIGENSPIMRERVCEGLKSSLDVEINKELNAKTRGQKVLISTSNSKIKVAIIPTDEELMIAKDAYTLTK